jgi:hypothetical protein
MGGQGNMKGRQMAPTTARRSGLKNLSEDTLRGLELGLLPGKRRRFNHDSNSWIGRAAYLATWRVYAMLIVYCQTHSSSPPATHIPHPSENHAPSPVSIGNGSSNAPKTSWGKSLYPPPCLLQSSPLSPKTDT